VNDGRSVRATPETIVRANGLRKYFVDDIKSGRLFHAAIAAVKGARHPSVCPPAYVSLQRYHETAYFVNRCRTRRCSSEKDSHSFGIQPPRDVSFCGLEIHCRCTSDAQRAFGSGRIPLFNGERVHPVQSEITAVSQLGESRQEKREELRRFTDARCKEKDGSPNIRESD